MPVLATITLREPSDWRQLVEYVREHAGPMAARGTPMQLLVVKKMSKRRDALNRLMWKGVLEQIAAQAVSNGRRYSAETWHDEMKRRHLPDVCAKGVEKWRYEDDRRVLNMSTGDLDDDEFHDYLLAVQAYAADRYLVTFTDREEQAA